LPAQFFFAKTEYLKFFLAKNKLMNNVTSDGQAMPEILVKLMISELVGSVGGTLQLVT